MSEHTINAHVLYLVNKHSSQLIGRHSDRNIPGRSRNREGHYETSASHIYLLIASFALFAPAWQKRIMETYSRKAASNLE